jgi:hypothetical protein
VVLCTVNDSTFTSNNATTYYGGAIYNGNGGAINGECTVTGSTFTGNSATVVMVVLSIMMVVVSHLYL